MYPFNTSVFPLLPLEIFALFVLLNLVHRTLVPWVFLLPFPVVLPPLALLPSSTYPHLSLQVLQDSPAWRLRADRVSPADPVLQESRALVVQQAAQSEQVLQDSLASMLRVDQVSPVDPVLPAPHAQVVQPSLADLVLEDSHAPVLQVERVSPADSVSEDSHAPLLRVEWVSPADPVLQASHA